MKTALTNIENGSSVIVQGISQSGLRVKLMEMGITEGRFLKVLFRAPFGDPIAVNVDGYVLSLRRDEAELIQVERQEVYA